MPDWEDNPYENQWRNARMCSVSLDTPVYNSHTTAVDALWAGYVSLFVAFVIYYYNLAGISVSCTRQRALHHIRCSVPLVTRSDGVDMGGR